MRVGQYAESARGWPEPAARMGEVVLSAGAPWSSMRKAGAALLRVSCLSRYIGPARARSFRMASSALFRVPVGNQVSMLGAKLAHPR